MRRAVMRVLGWILLLIGACTGAPVHGFLDELLKRAPPHPIICPVCFRANQRSTCRAVVVEGIENYDLVFYDEDGRQHNHNHADSRIQRFMCSNKHSFHTAPALCWCGWPPEK